MSFQNLIQSAKIYFPDLQIKYKKDNFLMKILGKILFFNPEFMSSYTTTIGHNVYYPNKSFVKTRPVSASIILLHEISHMYDSKKIGKLLFILSYLFPQILSLLFIPLLFISWKIALPFLLLSAPLPAIFRMYYEKRAYISSLYVMYVLGKKMKFDPKLEERKQNFIKQFIGSYYYFMWPFSNINQEFDNAMAKIQSDQHPFKDNLFDILDQLLKQV